MNTTARVDIERLQILNDRLCQTLEALNQVRMSAHNMGYSHFQHPAHLGYSNMSYPMTAFYGMNTQPTMPFQSNWGWSQPLPHTVTPFATPAYWGAQGGYRPNFFGGPFSEGRFFGFEGQTHNTMDPRFHNQFSSASQPLMF